MADLILPNDFTRNNLHVSQFSFYKTGVLQA